MLGSFKTQRTQREEPRSGTSNMMQKHDFWKTGSPFWFERSAQPNKTKSARSWSPGSVLPLQYAVQIGPVARTGATPQEEQLEKRRGRGLQRVQPQRSSLPPTAKRAAITDYLAHKKTPAS